MSARDNVRKGICWIIENRCDGNQTAFANEIGVTRQKVNNWVRNVCAPDLELVGDIARHYKLSLDWLIGGKSEYHPNVYKIEK